MTKEEKNHHMVEKFELLDFKLHSLIDIINLKNKKLYIKLPEVIDYPTEDNKSNTLKNNFFIKENSIY